MLEIRDLAVIGDQRTAALITSGGDIVWYCPMRFDAASLLAGLLDADKGGVWSVRSPANAPVSRRYVEDTAVLQTELEHLGAVWTVIDWMPFGVELPSGICREFSAAPFERTIVLTPAPDYGTTPVQIRIEGTVGIINERYFLYSSHPLQRIGATLQLTLPPGAGGWAFLTDRLLTLPPAATELQHWRDLTCRRWQELARKTVYDGPYAEQVRSSLLALRLLRHRESGGILAALTTSLPEVPGGARNYDYRYVWLRDAGMIVSALTRANSSGGEAKGFLDFICRAERSPDTMPLPPFTNLDGRTAEEERTLEHLAGFLNSRPVRIGNSANRQLQLDAYGNVLLAAKLMYQRESARDHWAIISTVADYLSENWHQPDYGLWEESRRQQYTSGKVVVACGLSSLVPFTDDAAQAQRWQQAVADIRGFVAEECVNAEGAYAAVAGGEAVDVTAALFPVWNYTAADSPQMIATLRVLERDCSEGGLFRRHLEDEDSRHEGVFLAASFWVAQYWVMRGEFAKARAIIDAGLAFSTDLGFLAEEGDPVNGMALGNVPQSFVHAALIGAVIDLAAAEKNGAG